MGHERRRAETKDISIGKFHYCSYCGEKAMEVVSWDSGQEWNEYYCVCEGAHGYAEMIRLQKQLERMEYKAKEKLKVLLFEAEVSQLRYKYGFGEGTGK